MLACRRKGEGNEHVRNTAYDRSFQEETKKKNRPMPKKKNESPINMKKKKNRPIPKKKNESPIKMKKKKNVPMPKKKNERPMKVKKRLTGASSPRVPREQWQRNTRLWLHSRHSDSRG
jgi:hypothetical protein